MEKNRLILGLDVSTTTIGIAIILVEEGKKKIIKVSHCSPKVKASVKGMEALFLKKKIADPVLSEI
jgi:hypothetical protein